MVDTIEYGTNSMAAPENKKSGSVFQESDVNAKKVFENPYLCAQFLRDYSNLEELKDVQPEDIEKVNLRYHLFEEVEHNSDTVVRVRRDKGEEGMPIYIVALVDHKSSVDYNVAMQLLCYMVCIWKDWEKEMEKDDISCGKKGFRYPIVFPVVYYEGTNNWTAGLHLADRICMSDILPQYVPDFTYHVVRSHGYSNEELLDKNDEISLVMLLNKLQKAGDFEGFRKISYKEIDRILKDSPEDVLNLIAGMVGSMCRKLNVPEDEANEYIGRIRGERKMGYFFENMEKMDIQEERRLRKEAQDKAKEAEDKAKEAEDKAKEAEDKAKEAEKHVRDAEKHARDVEKHARDAEKHARDAEKHAKEIENKAKDAEKRASEAEKQANEIKNWAERTYIETLQELPLGRDEVKNKFMKKFALNEEQVEEKMKLYWKES